MHQCSEAVETGWIVYKYLLPNGRVRRPDRESIEEEPIVDLEQRRNVGSLAARRRAGIGMRPVGAPKNVFRFGCDERLCEGRHIGVTRPLLRRTVRPGELHVSLA